MAAVCMVSSLLSSFSALSSRYFPIGSLVLSSSITFLNHIVSPSCTPGVQSRLLIMYLLEATYNLGHHPPCPNGMKRDNTSNVWYTQVPVGVPGRMWIAGPTLAIGYLNMPEKTAERFIEDPLALAAGRPGERMYDTGDRCRYLPSGSIEVIGRCDYMVKVSPSGFSCFLKMGGSKDDGMAYTPSFRR